MSEFLTYSKFHSREEAQELIAVLEDSGFEFKIDYERDVLDKIYTGESVDPMVSIRIRQDSFEDLNQVLLSKAETQLNDIDPNYYLFSFSDQELIEVVHNRNEWNYFDQVLAQKLLSDKNIAVPVENKLSIDSESYRPLHLNTTWLVSQYVLAILLAYVGILIGLATLLAYKTLRSGEKVSMYDEATRHNAKIILALGIGRTLFHFVSFFIL